MGDATRLEKSPLTNNDNNSLSVNPGSPRSLPPLNPELDEKHLSSGTEDFDLEKDAVSPEELPEPAQLRFMIDPAGDLTHDATSVDIVTVPCPGADPLRSWNRDGLISRFFGAPSMRYAEGEEDGRPAPSWVRQGIRREASMARVLLYEHLAVDEDMTLGRLADAFLQELQALRAKEEQDRPLMFIGHSVGGIVLKIALVKASRDARYDGIFRGCYGVAFFATPHQGSSYFAMPSLASSIQSLLQLTGPLPTSITDDLRVGNSLLLHVDEDFKCISNDLRVWTFYETIDSRLSGSATGDVYFTAPLASIKSAILGMRQERIFPLQSDHANIASFGRHNVHTLNMFLKQLAWQIRRADENARDTTGRWNLDLEQKVNIEVHGFFEDSVGPDNAETPVVRAWSTRLPLREFLTKGPEVCLSDRLNEVDGAPEESRFLRTRGRTTASAFRNALGISNQPTQQSSVPPSPVIRPVDAKPEQRRESTPAPAAIGSGTPPSRTMSPLTRHSTPMRNPSPMIRADFEQDLAVDRLSRPIRPRVGRSMSRSFSAGSEASKYEYRDFPPFSQRSRSTMNVRPSADKGEDDGGIEASPKLPESVIAIRKTVGDGKRRPSETVIVDEVPVAFAKPEVKARKFLWVHLPYNNPTWVKNILETLQVSEQRDFSPLYNHDFWATKHTHGRHAQHYAYYAKPGCYFTAPRTFSPRGRASRGGSLSPTNGDGSMFTCLFLPYLHFDSYKRLVRRRDMIIQRLNHGRARPIPEYVSKSDSVELQVIWNYLGHDPPINCRRTLDQYGYPSLRDTRSRDDDQMLYKLTKERACFPDQLRDFGTQGSSSRASDGGGSWRGRIAGVVGIQDDEEVENNVLNGNVLMVDQLWLWVLNSETVLSFFPKRESDPIEGPLYQQADLRDSIFNEVNVDLTRQCENALDLAALAALHAVSVLLDRSSHPDLEVFRIFEEAISVLTEKLTSSLKDFRAEGFRDKAFDYEPVENKERSIRARHKEEGRRAELENRNNTSALLELRDLEDELLIMLHLFERQSKVISSMHAVYTRPELRDRTANGRAFLTEALKRLGDYAHSADEMIQRVRATRDDYDKLLQMVQRQAQVDEVRLSRLHADLASAQSRSVMIFTTFTVIFLPLTFFTGLFGMNTREWGGEGNLPLRTIGAISLPASALLVVASLVIAWSTNVRRFFRWASKVYSRAMRWLYLTAYRPAARMVVRRVLHGRRKGVRGDRGEESQKRGVKREASDFWQRHRLERETGYQIPEVNRRGLGGAKTGSKGKKESGGR